MTNTRNPVGIPGIVLFGCLKFPQVKSKGIYKNQLSEQSLAIDVRSRA